MSSIDERVVNMRFNNSGFMNGIKSTLDALGRLKSGLNLDASKKSLDDLGTAGKNFNLGPIGSTIEGVNGKFLALATIGVTALSNIANQAIQTGSAMAKSLTIEPIMEGFREYELKMGSIQTILANTSAHGTQLPEVVSNLDDLNHYADKTIYNFGEMTKNIGLFTNAGIKVGDATSMIKGFSNEAAASGTSAEGAAGAAYQLSQALSAGKITLMDWRSLQNVGMGNANMKRGILEIAEAMGTLEGKGVTGADIQKDFNGSLEKGWLTADVMSNYLKIMAGDMDAATQKSLGLTDAQVEGFAKQQLTAEEAATKVRTATQLMGTLKEAVGSSWAETFDIVVGDFDKATELFTNVNNVLGTMIGDAGNARNALLQGWSDLGGRELGIEAIKNAFDALMAIINPIKEAFREIFPPATSQQLVNITTAIRDFTAGLKIGASTSENLKSTFRGVFAIFDIGLMVIKAALGMFLDLFGGLGDGAGQLLNFTGGLGEMIVRFRDSMKEGEGLTVLFSKIGSVLSLVIGVVTAVAGAIFDLFSGGGSDSGDLEGAIDRVKARFEPLGGLIDLLVTGWGKLGGLFTKAAEFFKPMADAFAEFFSGIGETVTEAVSGMDFASVLATINTGLFAGLVLMFKKFLSGGMTVDVGGGLFDTIKETLGSVTEKMGAMQAQLKASALIKIAGAIALLAVSLTILALIDPVKLATALGAITVMFGQLIGSLAAFNAVTTTFGALKLQAAAAGLVILAVAVLILAVAVRMLAGLSWEELSKGLAGVTVILGGLAGVAKLLQGNTAGLIQAGAGFILIAIAVKILASAVEDFAELSWEEMAKGLIGVGVVLTALALFTRLAETGKAAVAQGAGLILLAVALKLMASAVQDFADMDWETMGRGFAGMAVSLLLIAGAMQLMPKNMLVTAAALVVVAASLVIVAAALQTMGGMTWEEIAKGLITLAASLAIIAGAMYLMVAALPGAAALLVVSAALSLLAPVLTVLGAMTWEEIARGLTMLAGTFLVLGVAGLVLTPLIPTLLGLGAAVTLIGIGLALAGVGVLAFATAITILAAASAVGTVAIVAMVGGIIGLIPMAMTALGQGIVAFALIIAGAAPQLVAAMTTVLMSLLNTINTLAPQIVNTLVNLVMLLVNTLVDNVPKLVDAGLRMLTGILTGIANNIGQIVTAGIQIVTNFLNAISSQLPSLTNAGVNLVITFVNSVADSIRGNSGAMEDAGGNLASAIIDGMVNGIGRGVSSVVNAAKTMASNALSAAKKALGIASPSKEFYKVGAWSAEGAKDGLEDGSSDVEASAEDMGRNALAALRHSLSKMKNVNLDADLNPSPTIRPVLDLDQVKRDATGIDGILDPAKLKAAYSYARAESIAQQRRAAVNENTDTDRSARGTNEASVTFIQNNNSPAALSAALIYRNTKNQLSKVKGGIPK